MILTESRINNSYDSYIDSFIHESMNSIYNDEVLTEGIGGFIAGNIETSVNATIAKQKRPFIILGTFFKMIKAKLSKKKFNMNLINDYINANNKIDIGEYWYKPIVDESSNSLLFCKTMSFFLFQDAMKVSKLYRSFSKIIKSEEDYKKKYEEKFSNINDTIRWIADQDTSVDATSRKNIKELIFRGDIDYDKYYSKLYQKQKSTVIDKSGVEDYIKFMTSVKGLETKLAKMEGHTEISKDIESTDRARVKMLSNLPFSNAHIFLDRGVGAYHLLCLKIDLYTTKRRFNEAISVLSKVESMAKSGDNN